MVVETHVQHFCQHCTVLNFCSVALLQQCENARLHTASPPPCVMSSVRAVSRPRMCCCCGPTWSCPSASAWWTHLFLCLSVAWGRTSLPHHNLMQGERSGPCPWRTLTKFHLGANCCPGSRNLGEWPRSKACSSASSTWFGSPWLRRGRPLRLWSAAWRSWPRWSRSSRRSCKWAWSWCWRWGPARWPGRWIWRPESEGWSKWWLPLESCLGLSGRKSPCQNKETSTSAINDTARPNIIPLTEGK